MRKLIVTLAVGLMVSAASAQLRLFFDPAGVAERTDRGSTDNLSYGNPQVNGSGRLYVYAEYLNANDLWLGLGYNMTVVGGNGVITGGSNYNQRTGVGNRWTSRDQLLSGDQKNMRFRAAWIGDPSQVPGGAWNWDANYAQQQTGDPFNSADDSDPQHYRRTWDSDGDGTAAQGTTLLGYIDVSGTSGDIFFSIDPFGVARLGGSGEDDIYFGYGDGPVNANEVGRRTTLPDASFVPEPASLALLGLGALALRRRR